MRIRYFEVAQIVALALLAPWLGYFIGLVDHNPQWSGSVGYGSGFNALYISALFSSPAGLVVNEPLSLMIFFASAVAFVVLKKKIKIAGAIAISIASPLLLWVIAVLTHLADSIVFLTASVSFFAALVGLFSVNWRKLNFAIRSQCG